MVFNIPILFGIVKKKRKKMISSHKDSERVWRHTQHTTHNTFCGGKKPSVPKKLERKNGESKQEKPGSGTGWLRQKHFYTIFNPPGLIFPFFNNLKWGLRGRNYFLLFGCQSVPWWHVSYSLLHLVGNYYLLVHALPFFVEVNRCFLF